MRNAIKILIALVLISGCGKSQDELNRELDRQALAGNASAVRKLLEDGAKVDHADPNGVTPLMKAADSGNMDTVRELLEAGADVNAKDRSGDSALLHAVTESSVQANGSATDRPAMASELLKAGAYIEEKGKRDETALIRAAAWGSSDTVRALIQAGADLEATNSTGMTALMCAANQPKSVRDTFESVKLLLEAGADPEARSSEGKTAHDYAERHGTNEKVAGLLRPEEGESGQGPSTSQTSPLDALLAVPGKILNDLSQMDEFKEFRDRMNMHGLPASELEKVEARCTLHKPERGKVSCAFRNRSTYALEQIAVEFRGTTSKGGQHIQEFLFTPDKPLQPGESYTGNEDCGFTFDFDVSSFRLTGAVGKKAEPPKGESV